LQRKGKMNYEEFKSLTIGEKVTFFGNKYKLSYFCEDYYIGCLRGKQGHIVNLTTDKLPNLVRGWQANSPVIQPKSIEEENRELKDKLARRNLQIKDLKKEIGALRNRVCNLAPVRGNDAGCESFKKY